MNRKNRRRRSEKVEEMGMRSKPGLLDQKREWQYVKQKERM